MTEERSEDRQREDGERQVRADVAGRGDDAVGTPPSDSGHSGAASQAERNAEDESPA